MILKLVCRGVWRIYAICGERGECALLDFLQGSGRGDTLGRDKRRLLAELDRVAHTSYPPNDTEVSHKVDREHDIWQFTRGGVRVLWFYDDGRLMILSHGFQKETRKTPERELGRARRAKGMYLQAKRIGQLRFLEDQ